MNPLRHHLRTERLRSGAAALLTLRHDPRVGALRWEQDIKVGQLMSLVGETEIELDRDELAHDIANLKNKVADLAARLTDGADEVTRETLRGVEAGIADLYETLAAQATRSIESIEETVENRPWISLFAAFGLGCIASLFLIRRH